MKTNVTQNLFISVQPVNNPCEYNRWSEQQGYYICFVMADSSDRHRQLAMAEQEWMRGIIPSHVGYASSISANGAINNAIVDYEAKFGKLCVTEMENIHG